MENERKEFDFKTWAIKYGLKRGTVYVLQKESCCSEDNLRKLTNMEIDNFDISKAQKQVLGRAINELVEGGIQRESFEFSEGQFTNEVDAAVESPTEEPDKPIEPEETQEKPVEPEDQDKDQDEGEEISPEPEKENVAMDTAINPEAASHQDDDQETQKARRKKVSKNKGNFLILHINFCSLKKNPIILELFSKSQNMKVEQTRFIMNYTLLFFLAGFVRQCSSHLNTPVSLSNYLDLTLSTK